MQPFKKRHIEVPFQLDYFSNAKDAEAHQQQQESNSLERSHL